MGHGLDRRVFVGVGLFGMAGALARPAQANTEGSRAIAFLNVHTGDRVDIVYWAGGRYLRAGLDVVDWVLRDHRTGEAQTIDPNLLDLLYVLRQDLETQDPFELISGYRSVQTNEALRRTTSGVAKDSYHLRGQAVDVRLPGRALVDLRDTALALRGGGVGFYPKSNFVHIDVGPVRQW